MSHSATSAPRRQTRMYFLLGLVTESKNTAKHVNALTHSSVTPSNSNKTPVSVQPPAFVRKSGHCPDPVSSVQLDANTPTGTDSVRNVEQRFLKVQIDVLTFSCFLCYVDPIGQRQHLYHKRCIM